MKILIRWTSLFLSVATCLSATDPMGPAEFYWLMNRACYHGDQVCVAILLKHGADPTGLCDYNAFHKKYSFGYEPSSHLFIAAYAGQLEVVKLLVEAKADVNSREGEGQTPLWAACSKGHLEIAKYLLDSGADNELKGEGLKPSELAAKRGYDEIAALFKEPSRVRREK